MFVDMLTIGTPTLVGCSLPSPKYTQSFCTNFVSFLDTVGLRASDLCTRSQPSGVWHLAGPEEELPLSAGGYGMQTVNMTLNPRCSKSYCRLSQQHHHLSVMPEPSTLKSRQKQAHKALYSHLSSLCQQCKLTSKLD